MTAFMPYGWINRAQVTSDAQQARRDLRFRAPARRAIDSRE
jgi:hypothetical protein